MGGLAPVAIPYERPSRTSWVLVTLSALMVVALSGWILTPIVLAKYQITLPGQLVVDTGPLRGDAETRPAPPSPERAAPERLSPERVSPEAHDLVITTPEPKKETIETVETPEPSPQVTASVQDRPTLAAASAEAAVLTPAERVAAGTPAVAAPWPAGETMTLQAEGEPTEELADVAPDFGPVPLPRPRPNFAALERLAIPLPRPRPAEIPAAAGETIPVFEQLMFDRLSLPN